MFDHTPHPIVIPMEDPLLHMNEYPFCSDPTCPDKEDPELLAEVAQLVQDGLLTPDEATHYVRGEML